MPSEITAKSAEFAVAVIGLAGSFPGAPTPHHLWGKLCRGEESIGRLPSDRTRAPALQ